MRFQKTHSEYHPVDSPESPESIQYVIGTPEFEPMTLTASQESPQFKPMTPDMPPPDSPLFKPMTPDMPPPDSSEYHPSDTPDFIRDCTCIKLQMFFMMIQAYQHHLQ